jgi:hypothetical protein
MVCTISNQTYVVSNVYANTTDGECPVLIPVNISSDPYGGYSITLNNTAYGTDPNAFLLTAGGSTSSLTLYNDTKGYLAFDSEGLPCFTSSNGDSAKWTWNSSYVRNNWWYRSGSGTYRNYYYLGQNSQSETYYLTASNGYNSWNCTLYQYVTETVTTLDEVLNVEGGTLHFTSTGSYPWTAVTGNPDYAQSGNGRVGSSSSELSLSSLAMKQGDKLTFRYYYSTEANYDKVYFYVNGAVQSAINGKSGSKEWTDYTFTASADGTYSFLWTYTKDGSTDSGSDCFRVDDVAFIPDIVTHTVRFLNWDGSVWDTQVVVHGQGAERPATDPTREGYIFTGWSPDFSYIDSDLDVTAQFVDPSTLHYTVTFRYMDSDGNWQEITKDVNYDQTAPDPRDDLPDPPEGYEFKDWDKSLAHITRDVTINAVYKQVATTKYVVNLRAVYGRADAGSVTHINWYSNAYDAYGNPIPGIEDKITPVAVDDLFTAEEQTGTEGEKNRKLYLDIAAYEGDPDFVEGKGYCLTYDGIDITERVKIPTPYTLPGYTFLGWARVPTGTDNSEIGPDNVYLKWVQDEQTGKWVYKAWSKDKNEWVEVTQVAADEEKPYHDMFAVWQGSFQIYHSGLDSDSRAPVIETIPIDRKLTDGGYNLAAKTTEGCLYGGYYIAKEGGFQPPAEVNGVRKAYDGTNWTWKNAETECGLGMTPVGGEMYYIKEVPSDKFLLPYLHYTYTLNSGAMANAWLISNFDDANYKQLGFVVVQDNKQARVVGQLTISAENGGRTIVLKPSVIWGVDSGYLSYREVFNAKTGVNLIADGTSILNYWVTLDGVLVTGRTLRTIHNNGNNVLNGNLTVTDDVNNNNINCAVFDPESVS